MFKEQRFVFQNANPEAGHAEQADKPKSDTPEAAIHQERAQKLAADLDPAATKPQVDEKAARTWDARMGFAEPNNPTDRWDPKLGFPNDGIKPAEAKAALGKDLLAKTGTITEYYQQALTRLKGKPGTPISEEAQKQINRINYHLGILTELQKQLQTPQTAKVTDIYLIVDRIINNDPALKSLLESKTQSVEDRLAMNGYQPLVAEEWDGPLTVATKPEIKPAKTLLAVDEWIDPPTKPASKPTQTPEDRLAF